MMRDEQDVAAAVLQHLASQGVDGILVADNGSMDGTRSELDRAASGLSISVVVVDDDEPAYYQSRKMSALAGHAASLGADWVIPFDADELWSSTGRLRLADVLRSMPATVTTVEADLFNHFATAKDPTGPNPFLSMQWKHPDRGRLPKVAARYQPGLVVHQGNHGATHPAPGEIVAGAVEVRHFPYRSFDHFARKARNGLEAYRATDLPDSEGAHWRQYGLLLEEHGEPALREVWEQWFWFFDPAAAGLEHDPAPWCGGVPA